MKKHISRNWAVFALVVAMCGVIATVVLTHTPEGETKPQEALPPGMPVTVESVMPGSYPATISALGEVVPQWESTIKSQVNGRIVFISDRLRVGNMVKRDELLVQVAKDRLEMELAEAHSRLAEANVALLKEEREFSEARKNWRQSGIDGDPQSPLVLRKPQLRAATHAVKASRAALAHAEAMLAHADIRAPFDAVIVQRTVNPGEMLFPGDTVATLYDMKTAQISIHLDATQWKHLGQQVNGDPAILHDPLQGASWPAQLVRDSRRLDNETRLRTLFLQVDQPLQHSPPLLPGTFVRTVIKGRPVDDLLCIPGTALTKEGVVWLVNTQNRLVRYRTDPVFYDENVVYVHTPEQMTPPMKVAISPNTSFTNGLAVQPISAERN